MDAALELRFQQGSQGRTVLRVERQDSPLRVLRAFETPSGEALVHILNNGGGLLAGDRYSITCAVEAGAAAQVTTAGATRIYRGKPGAVQTTEFCLGEGALLEYLPDPVIPFRGATYTQRSRMVLGRGATLLAWDLFTPGREASGECFAFTHLANALRIETAEGPLAVEDWALTPDAGGIDTAARLGPFTSHASFYVCQADPAARWRELLQQLQAISSEQSQPPEVTWGVSLLARDGLVVRGASRNSRLLATGLLPFWQCAKLALTGRPASAPRKVR